MRLAETATTRAANGLYRNIQPMCAGLCWFPVEEVRGG